MRAPVDVAACGWLLADADEAPVFAAALAADRMSLDTRPEPGSGETSHFELPS